MNELAQVDYSIFGSRISSLSSLSLQELARVFSLLPETRRRLARDRPDLWNYGYLPVVPGNYWDTIVRVANRNDTLDPLFWMNIRYLDAEQVSVLVPRHRDEPSDSWTVLIDDHSLSSARPVTFLSNNYQWTLQPSFPCLPDRGTCKKNTCDDENHQCEQHYSDNDDKGGEYFFCECEPKG